MQPTEKDILKYLQRHLTLYRITPEGLSRLKSRSRLEDIDADILQMLAETGGSTAGAIADELLEIYSQDMEPNDCWEILRGMVKSGWIQRVPSSADELVGT